MPALLEYGLIIEAVAPGDDGIFHLVQRRADFVRRPTINPAFLAFRVGVERGVLAAVRRLRLAYGPAWGLVDDAQQQWIVRDLQGPAVQREQCTIVVQHFFEMRNIPLRIDAVAEKAAA